MPLVLSRIIQRAIRSRTEIKFNSAIDKYKKTVFGTMSANIALQYKKVVSYGCL